ncbi:MAG: TPM domain-containing protein [Betaproteobacteria bacterium]|nr:TPM domain-containing protein [Betaproteobacteria bacterium]
MDIKRIIKHLFAPPWAVTRMFPAETMKAIENAIRESERSHDGELRFAIEGGLKLWLLLHERTPRARAIEIFSQLRVWDTEHNSGVLIYVQTVDRHIEIIADRGINARVEQRQWEAIAGRMQTEFRAERYEAGAIEGMREITALLARHFPPTGANPDELPDAPVVL